jgi:hypothetical protein
MSFEELGMDEIPKDPESFSSKGCEATKKLFQENFISIGQR